MTRRDPPMASACARPIRGVPTLLVHGAARSVQTARIARLLAARVPGERIAVLLAPRPLAALGAAAIESAEGVTVREAPPGCACCVGAVGFRVALTRLLREARPDRLVIELGPADHVDEARRTLRGEYFAAVIALDDDRTD